jgi:hypothetical protein
VEKIDNCDCEFAIFPFFELKSRHINPHKERNNATGDADGHNAAMRDTEEVQLEQ